MKWLFVILSVMCLTVTAKVKAEEPTDPKPVIVFDFGGVMVDTDVRPILNHCADRFQMTPEEFYPQFKQRMEPLACGHVTEEGFWTQWAEEVGIELSPSWKEEHLYAFVQCSTVRPAMFELVEKLKANGYRVAVLSDVGEWAAEVYRDQGLYELFSPVLLSCEMGAHKPSREAYEILMDELGVPTQQVIFIDDKINNVEAARELGIQAFQYTTFEEIHSLLEEVQQYVFTDSDRSALVNK